MTPEIETPDMPIPFGIDDAGQALPGIDDETIEDFKADGHETSVARELIKQKAESDEADFGVTGDVDPNKLDETGWAVIFGPGADRKIRQALQPLLEIGRASCRERV